MIINFLIIIQEKMMGWCIGILLLIVGFVLFMIPGSQTIGWILWMAGIVCFGGQGFINYKNKETIRKLCYKKI